MSTRFTALEIGSGDAFLLEDEGKTILFDSGGNKSHIKRLLKEEGVTRINLAICSHNDGDHANGFIGLLKSDIDIDEIWLPYWWSSILQYANDHVIDWYKVESISNEINEANIKDYNPELMFSEEHEPIFLDKHQTLSGEAFESVLSELAERMNYKDILSNPYRLFFELAYDIAHNMIDSLAHDTRHELSIDLLPFEAHNVAQQVSNEVARDIARLVVYHIADPVARHVANHASNGPHTADILRNYLCDHNQILAYLPSHSFNYLVTSSNSNSSIRIMFNNIMEIAVLAHKRGCAIKWFEPTKNCTRFPILGTNFIALNSTLKRKVQKLSDTIALAFALHLTVENEYSLAFEYLNEDGIPIVRFSADSDCECGSLPYNKSIIITAPHHGSEANANVYDAIDPNNQDNIIWVRSDALNKTQGRPCDKFKSRKNKYCLACKYRISNKKFEVCFEYNTLSQQWKPIHGYTCNCQPNNN